MFFLSTKRKNSLVIYDSTKLKRTHHAFLTVQHFARINCVIFVRNFHRCVHVAGALLVEIKRLANILLLLT